jgi:acetamidase/formamidase
LTPEHVHWGYYDSRVPPVLRIVSGDRVRVETMIAGGLQRLRFAGVAESEIPDSLKAVELGVTERGPGAHPLTGPIFVEGAEPGDTLEVRTPSLPVAASSRTSFHMRISDCCAGRPAPIVLSSRRACR